MRFLSPRLHAYLDLVFIVLFAIGPLAFGLGGAPLLISFSLAAVLLLLTLATRFPLGIAPRVSFFVHGLVELAMTIFIAVLPRLDGYSPGSPARRFYWGMAIALALVWLVTDYRGSETTHRGDAARPASAA